MQMTSLMVLFLNGAITFSFSPDCELLGCWATVGGVCIDGRCSPLGYHPAATQALTLQCDAPTEMTHSDTKQSVPGKSNFIIKTLLTMIVAFMLYMRHSDPESHFCYLWECKWIFKLLGLYGLFPLRLPSKELYKELTNPLFFLKLQIVLLFGTEIFFKLLTKEYIQREWLFLTCRLENPNCKGSVGDDLETL